MTNKPRCFNSCTFMKYLECEHTRDELEIFIKKVCPSCGEPPSSGFGGGWMPHPAYQMQGTMAQNASVRLIPFNNILYDSTDGNIIPTITGHSYNSTNNAFLIKKPTAWLVNYKFDIAPRVSVVGYALGAGELKTYTGIDVLLNPNFNSTLDLINGDICHTTLTQNTSNAIYDSFIFQTTEPDAVLVFRPIDNAEIILADMPIQTNITFTRVLLPYPYDQKDTAPPWIKE